MFLGIFLRVSITMGFSTRVLSSDTNTDTCLMPNSDRLTDTVTKGLIPVTTNLWLDISMLECLTTLWCKVPQVELQEYIVYIILILILFDNKSNS